MQSVRDFFDLLSIHMAQGLPFVAYRNPSHDGAVKALLQPDSNVYKASDFTESGFVFAPFDDSQKAILLPSKFCKEITTSFSDIEEKASKEQNRETVREASEEKEVHLRLVQKGIDSIMKGDLKKVVLSRKEEVPLENPDPIEIFKRLLIK